MHNVRVMRNMMILAEDVDGVAAPGNDSHGPDQRCGVETLVVRPVSRQLSDWIRRIPGAPDAGPSWKIRATISAAVLSEQMNHAQQIRVRLRRW